MAEILENLGHLLKYLDPFSAKESIAPISRVLFWHCCQRLPFIYCARHHAPLAFYPPSQSPERHSGGQPSVNGLHELAASSGNSPTVTRRLVVSYTHLLTLTPSLTERRSFSSSLTSCRQLLLLSEVERPVLPGLSSRVSLQKRQRQSRSSAFGGAKLRINE